jgi:hypothetical protein
MVVPDSFSDGGQLSSVTAAVGVVILPRKQTVGCIGLRWWFSLLEAFAGREVEIAGGARGPYCGCRRAVDKAEREDCGQ